MSAVAAPRTRRPRARARVRRAPARVGVTSALLIMACAAVLIGIVTLQVAVLRLNSERGDLQAQRDQVASANSELAGSARRPAGPRRAGGQKAAKQGLVLAPVEVDRRRARLATERGHEAPAATALGAAARRPPHPPDADVRVRRACWRSARARCRCSCSTAARSRRRPRRSSASRCRCGRRAGRSSTAPARSSRSPTGPSPSGVWPARLHRSHRVRAGALAVHEGSRPREIEKRMGGSAKYVFVARRIDPSTWTRIRGDPVLGPLVNVARDRAASRSRAASIRRAAWPPRSSASTAHGLSGVEMLAQRRAQRARRPGPGLEGQRPSDGRRALGARPARARAGAGQVGAAHARHAHPAARAEGDRADARSSGTPRRSRRSCSIRAPAASSPWPRCPACRRRATAPAIADEWRLRAITDLYEPGSTFKLVTFMGALQEGVILAEDDVPRADRYTKTSRTALRAHDPGRAPSPGRELDGDRHPRALLQRGHDHDRREAAAARRDCRSGSTSRASASATGVDLPGEEQRTASCPKDKWYGTGILNVPIGEGIAVTPLQMAALYASIANKGMWIQPHVTASIGGEPTRAGRRASSSRRTSRPSCARC